MKALVSCLSVLLLVSGNTPPAQAPQTADSCHFTVSGELAKPTISGPEDITALVYVVEQPDSPVEILAIDFKDSWLSVAHERVTEQLRCTMKIRNRSDQQVKGLDLHVIVGPSPSSGPGTGFGGFPALAGQTRSLAPGQEADIIGCGGGGSGGARPEITFESSYMSTESTGMVASTYHRNGYPIEPGIFVHNG